jgi:hypothetical protein
MAGEHCLWTGCHGYCEPIGDLSGTSAGLRVHGVGQR